MGFVGIVAIDTETLSCEVPGEGSSHVGESEFGGVFRRVSPGRGLVQMRGVDPGDGRCRHAEMQMIGHRVGIAGLRVGAADFLLDLATAGLDIPLEKPL